MLIYVNTSKPAIGLMDDYSEWMGRYTNVMREHDIPATIKVTDVGAPEVEVYTICLFNDWEAYGEKMEKARASDGYKDLYHTASQKRMVVGVDSFIGELLPGFNDEFKLAEGVVAASVWRPLGGKTQKLVENMLQAKTIHEKHEAVVRAWAITGGRYTGAINYTLAYPSLSALGKAWQAGKAEQDEFMAKASADPSAQVLAQMILNNPIILKS